MHDKIRPYVEKGLITRVDHPTRDLVLYNYTQQCQFEKAWDDVTRMCRGLILDSAGNIVARPLGKFQNWEEHHGPIPSGRPEVYEKLDGSLLIATLQHGYSPVFATRGSFFSAQAQWAEEHMLEHYGSSWMEDGWTYCFEIIYPNNRIVVDYGKREDLVLLAKIDNDTSEEAHIHHDVPEWTGPIAEQFLFESYALEDLKSEDIENQEGYVLFWPREGLRLKVKFETYVRLHKILTGVHARHIWERMRDGESLAPLIEMVPDEFMRWVEETRDEILDEFQAVEHRAKRLFFTRPNHSNRAEFARWAQEQPSDLRPILFKLLDGERYDDTIWKQIKPAADRPFSSGMAA